ncbi:SMP-30/gluconolactonase/LRE family protein [Echinicola sediminis]
MNLKSILTGSTLLVLAACGKTNHSKQEETGVVKEEKSPFSIEILDNEALELMEADAEIKRMASGFSWTEGPLWMEEGGFLLFSDIPNNKVYKMTTAGDTSTFLHPSGYSGEGDYSNERGSNGLLISSKGELILMQHGDRRVAKMEAPISDPKPQFKTLAEGYQGKRFNSPNDGVFDKEGNLYFTDPPYGLPSGYAGKELDFQGIYCLKPSGELLLLDSLSRPNGIALSPDERQLYVAVSDEGHAVWYQYVLDQPGKVSGKKLFYDATTSIKQGEKGLPDGMEVHREGYLFATGPSGVWVFSPSGKVLARIHTGQLVSNCTFTPDYKWLYLTADDDILRVSLK